MSTDTSGLSGGRGPDGGTAGPPVVRGAESRDLESIARIYNQSILARDSTMDLVAKDADDFGALVATMNDRECLLVLEAGGEVEAWGILKKYSERPGYRHACETSVYVDRRRVGRRTGTGSALQEELMRCCRKYGYHHVVAKIWADNVISIRMHEKHGFERVGVQREIGFVDGRRVDVLVMQLLL